MKVKNLIAPCGMNCALCQAYQGKGLKCFGCGNMSKRKSCQNCFIFIHKDFKFQIWLSGINRNIQEKYFNIYKNTKYNCAPR